MPPLRGVGAFQEVGEHGLEFGAAGNRVRVGGRAEENGKQRGGAGTQHKFSAVNYLDAEIVGHRRVLSIAASRQSR